VGVVGHLACIGGLVHGILVVLGDDYEDFDSP
jgi:hypothetical protein